MAATRPRDASLRPQPMSKRRKGRRGGCFKTRAMIGAWGGGGGGRRDETWGEEGHSGGRKETERSRLVPREQMVEPSHLAGHKRSFCLPTGSLGLAGHNSGATCQKKRTLFLEPHRPNKTAPQETLSPAATNRFHKPLTPTQASPPPTILLLLRPIGWVVWAEPKKSPNEHHRRGANQLDVAGAAVSQSSAGSLKVCWGLFGCGSQHFPNSITNWNEDRV
ncbi:uncharacterized protein LOC120892554 [Ictidomys tridecemlineatus]